MLWPSSRCTHDASFCDDIIHSNIVWVGIDVVDKLKIICDTNLYRACIGKQTVIVAFATADSVASSVICDSRHNDHVYFRYVDHVITVRFFDVECPKMQP